MGLGLEQDGVDSGCAFILGDIGERRCCGTRQRLGSSYCPEHHALCHVPCGTTEEQERLREVEALANAAGGRRARGAVGPSPKFLRRMEHAVRVFS